MLFIYFFALSYNINSGLSATNFSYIDELMIKISLEVKSKTIITFTFDNPSDNLNENLIFSKTTQRLPSLLLNMDKKPDALKYARVFENPRKHSCFIIILRNNFDEPHTKKLQEVIKFTDSSATKARLLAIFVDEDAWDINILKNILLYGWKQKYLDFTIIYKNKGNNLIIMHYNPFTVKFFTESYNSKTTIFPDKLKNMNGYSMKTPITKYPPYVDYIVSNSLIKVNSLSYDIFKTICEKLNCNLNEDPLGSLDDLARTKIILGLQKNIYHFVNVGILRSRFHSIRKYVLMGIEYDHEKLIFLVPKLAVSEFSIPNIFEPLFRAALFNVSFFILAKVFKFPKRFWNLMNLYGILLGNRVRFLAFSTLQRIIYSLIFFSAIGITAEFLTPTKIKIVGKGSLDSLEKLAESNIPIFATSQLYSDWYIQTINKTKMNYTLDNNSPKLESNIDLCIRKLLDSQNAICIMGKSVGDYYAKKI